MTIILFGIWFTFAGYGVWIANIKRRHPGEGLALGLLLGPAGCCVAAALRERSPEEVEQERVRRQEEAQARLEEEKERQANLRAEAARHRREAEERAESARIRRAEAAAEFSKKFEREILRFGWYKALPEVAQAIVLGLSLALPLVAVLVFLFRGR